MFVLPVQLIGTATSSTLMIVTPLHVSVAVATPVLLVMGATVHLVVPNTSTNLILFINDTATAEIYTLSLHDVLPILHSRVIFAGQVMTGGTVSLKLIV